MKKLNQKRMNTLKVVGGLIGLVIFAFMFFNPITAIAAIAIAPIVGIEMTDKEEKFLNHVVDQVKAEIAKHDKGYISETRLNEVLTSKWKDWSKGLTEGELKDLNDALDAQGIKINQLSENGVGKLKKITMEEFIEKNKETLLDMVKHGSNDSLTIKADTVRANLTDSKVAYLVPEIGQIATRKLTLYDLFAKVPVGPASGGVVTYYDWDEATVVRAAAVIAENGVFPESTAKWKWYTKPLVKVGDTLPVSEEFDKDLPMFAAELAQFLQTNVDIAVDTQLYSGDGTGSNMTGVYASAGTYAAAASGITDANIYDLVVDVKRSMTAAKGSKYAPNFALMNSSDIIKYKLKKDSNNNYVMPPFASENGQIIDNILVIETSAVTANTMLIGDNRYAKIYEVDGYTLAKGLADGDFMSDMFTLKARRRLMLLVKNADTGAFKKVTSISAALTTLATA